jgi:SAM-dependent methyltransferase
MKPAPPVTRTVRATGATLPDASVVTVGSVTDVEWPGEERRRPPATSATWAVRAPLAAWLEAQAAAAGRDYRVLDVGCGPKPYYPFFAERAREYVGIDVVENPAAELRGPVEALPVEDGSFDVVLCTQVLEHCDDPAQAVRELRRVTAPGGRVLASTHGVQVYHPSPQDYWRWTHEGLRRLFEEGVEWASVEVTPGAGTATTLAMLLGTYVEIALRRTRLARGPVWLLNRAGAALDARVTSLREPVPGALIANFHVRALVGG